MLFSLMTLMACSVDPVAFGEAPALQGADSHQVIVFVGDTGDPTTTQAQVLGAIQDYCRRRTCSGIVLLGDLIYPLGATATDVGRLDDLVGTYGDIAPTYLVLGNHDYGRGRDHAAVERLSAWAARRSDVHLPGQAYTVDLGVGVLAVVDTNRVFQYGDEGQGEWLDEALTRPGWRIVAGHHPFRSNGPHGNAGQYEGRSYIPWLSGNSVAAFMTEHVCGTADIYVSGHDHNLQVISDCGTRLVVSGSGAKVRELIDRGNSPEFSSAKAGFTVLDLTDSAGFLSVVGADGETLFEAAL